MILIALGANLPSDAGPPVVTLAAVLTRLQAQGIRVIARSGWWESEAVPPSGQPRFINAVAALATLLPPAALMVRLHALETDFGRIRRQRWDARPCDLDLLDYDGRVGEDDGVVLPHPRIPGRAFVLNPLAEVVPGWRHPADGMPLPALLAALPRDQQAWRFNSV